jgi:endoglucanase
MHRTRIRVGIAVAWLYGCSSSVASPPPEGSDGTGAQPSIASGGSISPSSGGTGFTNASGGQGGGGASEGGTQGSPTGGASSVSSGGAETGGSRDVNGSGGTNDTGGAPEDAGQIVLPSNGENVAPTSGYLHTDGSKIVDASGKEVRLTGISWFGMETSTYAPNGLWTRSMASFLDQMKSLGYNSVRVPFCSQMFDAGSTPNSIDQNSNPDLVGLSPIQILDKLVAGAKARGLKIILDRHRPDSGGQSALWYTSQYSEERWIADWKMLATHYAGNTTVVGFDLHNEPHDTASWGDGNAATDWRAAAERAGNAVLAINPELLIIVEGIQNYGTSSYWWGGNLRGAKTAPVNLNVNHRLVYSIHDYPSSVSDQTWFHDANYPSNLPSVWHDTWGYLVDSGTAPVWIGEFGTKLQTTSDQQWLGALASYIQGKRLSFAFWCWNPNSGDTGGILQDDWSTVNQAKQSVLGPLLGPLVP